MSIIADMQCLVNHLIQASAINSKMTLLYTELGKRRKIL